MKASEILRKLADVIDRNSDKDQAYTSTENPVSQVAHTEPVQATNDDNTEPTTMIAPLQQKLELLKKVTGADSIYDADDECENKPDELDIIKRSAGIHPVVLTTIDDGLGED